jgi:hypothetical protein
MRPNPSIGRTSNGLRPSAAEAHAYMETNANFGKIVLSVG